MRLMLFGPRILGVRVGVSFNANDLRRLEPPGNTWPWPHYLLSWFLIWLAFAVWLAWYLAPG